MNKRFIAPLLTLALWLGVLSWWTSGFAAFTTYSHTLEAAGPLPRAAPRFEIRDHFGVVHDTGDFRGRYVLLQFTYLSCGDVCPLAMADFYRIHEALDERIAADLLLLTVSFDPRRDSTERLFASWQHFGRPAGWTFAALTAPLDEQSQAELRRLGVWVSRRDGDLYNHSAQAFLIDTQGQVVQVFTGPGSSGAVVEALRERLT